LRLGAAAVLFDQGSELRRGRRLGGSPPERREARSHARRRLLVRRENRHRELSRLEVAGGLPRGEIAEDADQVVAQLEGEAGGPADPLERAKQARLTVAESGSGTERRDEAVAGGLQQGDADRVRRSDRVEVGAGEVEVQVLAGCRGAAD